MNQTDQLAIDVGIALKKNNFTIATAESCTGGGISEAITSVPGSSAWFDCAFVTYSYEAKTMTLGVKPETWHTYGAVSEQTATEMVAGALRYSRASVAISVTGIAGPDGGTPEKPVGTVWFAWGWREGKVITEKMVFPGNRLAVRTQTIAHALTVLVNNLD